MSLNTALIEYNGIHLESNHPTIHIMFLLNYNKLQKKQIKKLKSLLSIFTHSHYFFTHILWLEAAQSL